MKRRIVMVGAAAAAAGFAAAWWLRHPQGDVDPLPESLWRQRFERPDGGDLAMADWRGRPLVLNFWATWCAPCVKELPALDRFHQAQGEQGWRVLALAIDGASAVREFLLRVPVTMPVGVAGLAGTELIRDLGNAQGGLPFTVMIGANGKAVWRKLGETTFEELQRLAARFSA